MQLPPDQSLLNVCQPSAGSSAPSSCQTLHPFPVSPTTGAAKPAHRNERAPSFCTARMRTSSPAIPILRKVLPLPPCLERKIPPLFLAATATLISPLKSFAATTE